MSVKKSRCSLTQQTLNDMLRLDRPSESAETLQDTSDCERQETLQPYALTQKAFITKAPLANPYKKNKALAVSRAGEVPHPCQDELQNGPAPLPSSSLDPKLIAAEEEIEKLRRYYRVMLVLVLSLSSVMICCAMLCFVLLAP